MLGCKTEFWLTAPVLASILSTEFVISVITHGTGRISETHLINTLIKPAVLRTQGGLDKVEVLEENFSVIVSAIFNTFGK